jgi:hypothetical protein
VEHLEDRVVPATITVNSLADLLNPPTGITTLRSAIQAANANPGDDTINLGVEGTYKITLPGAGEDANATGDFDILAAGGNLTIVNTSGGKVTIDGGGHDRIFDINPTFNANNPTATPNFKVTVQGLTLQNGIAAPFGDGTMGGGAIRDTGNASLELDNCVVTNNRASGAGGGILMQNTVNTPWTLTLNNTIVSNNHAGDAGGGIDTLGSGKVFINAGSQFLDNTCVNQGAAIWLDTINNASATMTMTGTTVSRNYAFNGPTGALGSAGNGAVSFIGCVVSENYSGTTGGGYGSENMLANVTITNSFFLNNVAQTDGGGIQAGGSGTTTVIVNSVFAGNTAGGNGGGVFLSGGSATLFNDRLAGNTATNGGGIEDQAVTLALSFCAFDANVAVGNANGDGGQGGGLDAQTGVTSITIANCLFLNNTAANGPNGVGGALFQNVGTLTITNSQFTGNDSSGSGGALDFLGGTLTVLASTFNGNHTDTGNGGAVAVLAGAGAATFTNDTFTGNAASQQFGGAVDVENSVTNTFLNDTISGNSAKLGGGLNLFRNGPNAGNILQNTIVALNTAGTGPDVLTSAGFSVTDHGGNFIGTLSGAAGFAPGTLTGNPLLGPLLNNGGAFAGLFGNGFVVQTEALQPGSTAIGGGVALGAPTTDERGFPRPAAGRTVPSIGAFEPQYARNATANQVFIESLYNVLFNRSTANDPGSAGWVTLLNNGAEPQTIIQAFQGSAEYRADLVQQLFEHYLDRNAAPNDAQGFGSYLSNHTVEQLAALLAGSAEYAQLHGGSNDSLLEGFYADGLGRAGSLTEVASWESLLGSSTPTQVAAQILGSQEYQTNLVDFDFATLLGRPADSGSEAGFVAYLKAGATDQMLQWQILGSDESFADHS